MPGTIIFENEIEESGEGEIRDGGNLYIKGGRKYIGMKVRYFIMKDEGQDK